MIEVDRLTKKYGPLTAVDAVSFRVEKGEILGFLGPNGAGKSTTMKMLSCFITPSTGTARICGHDILCDSLAVRRTIGYLPESAPSYQNMTVIEFLDFIAATRGYEKNEKSKRIDRIIDLTALETVRQQTIQTLSKGFRQRVGFAQALIHDPPVLILDEPTDGLDPNQKQEVRTLIQQMAKEKSIILSTHILEEMEAVCTRAVIINQGRIVADGSPENLRQYSSLCNVVCLILERSPAPSVIEGLRNIAAVSDVIGDTPTPANECFRLRIIPTEKTDILNDVNNFVRKNDIRCLEVYREKGQMDEVFRHLTVGGTN
jgi:ABC-2 type transport system ATP-binding protein